MWLQESQCQDLSSWSREEPSLLQQNKSVPDWTDRETMAVSFNAASYVGTDPWTCVKCLTESVVLKYGVLLFPLKFSFCCFILRWRLLLSGPRQAECLNPGSILSKLIFPISMCLHLKCLSKFIPCLHSIGSMTRTPSYYDGEDANDDNMLSRLLFVWAEHHRCSPSSGWWNQDKFFHLYSKWVRQVVQWSHLPCDPPPKGSQMCPWRVSWCEETGALE